MNMSARSLLQYRATVRRMDDQELIEQTRSDAELVAGFNPNRLSHDDEDILAALEIERAEMRRRGLSEKAAARSRGANAGETE